MFSAGAYTARFLKTGRWPRWPFFSFAGLTWLDGGGFTILNKFGRYPWSVGNYANLVALLKPMHWATLDFPCEPDITRALGLMTNADRITQTVTLAQECAYYEDMLPGVMVPVIQGYTLNEYKACIDLYHERNLIRDYMAVGSMCRRISDHDLHILIPGITEYAWAAGAQRLHYFGLKVDRSLLDLSEFIYSRDSAAILDDRSPDLRAARGGRRFPRGQAEKRAVVERFFETLDHFGLRYIENRVTGRVPLHLVEHPDAACMGDGLYIDHGEYLYILMDSPDGVG
jgi:hypothetical protein